MKIDPKDLRIPYDPKWTAGPIPSLEEMLEEAGQTPGTLTTLEYDIKMAAIQACDAHGIPKGPLVWRLGILAGRAEAQGARHKETSPQPK